MLNETVKEITVNISEDQTIIELSKMIQLYDSEIYLKKVIQGSIIEINLKSFLGLINLRLGKGDSLTIRAVGEDSNDAVQKVAEYLTKGEQ